MRNLGMTLALAVVYSVPVHAQSAVELQQVADGLARGECSLLTHVAENRQSGDWRTVDDSPWESWTIRSAGPHSVEYTLSSGETRLLELLDGVYRDRPSDAAGQPAQESDDWVIAEYTIHSPENWRLLLVPPRPPGVPENLSFYSEIVMAGNVYVWTSWMDDGAGSLRRTMYSACELIEVR